MAASKQARMLMHFCNAVLLVRGSQFNMTAVWRVRKIVAFLGGLHHVVSLHGRLFLTILPAISVESINLYKLQTRMVIWQCHREALTSQMMLLCITHTRSPPQCT